MDAPSDRHRDAVGTVPEGVPEETGVPGRQAGALRFAAPATPPGERIPGGIALLATVALHVVVAVFALSGWTLREPPPLPPPPDAVISVVFLPPATPPVPVETRVAPAPTPDARRASPDPEPPEPVRDDAPDRVDAVQPEPLPPLPDAPLPAASDASATAAVAPAQLDSLAAAPPSPPAPPGPQLAGQVDDRWEARVMARLAEFRRYPGAARARREEGVAVVRMRMNRAGKVLSVVLERSSGSPRLDAAALETFHRAEPLPRIPDTMADEVEIAVPVEFFIR
ncbi:energy transducer TonB [Luteimonas sp. XNQY3]|nr:energy transducer TonB [Luteimonas sp. XNQY3]MCD9006771.1 energy transducer TonB [Luteimonas sp. XNQY3]